MADVTKEQVVDFLSKMSVLDLAGLTKELEDKWGVKAAPVAVAAAAGPAAGGAAAAAAPAETGVTVPLGRAGADRVHRRADRRRRQQDRRHQGGPRGHQPGPERGQGPGRRRPQDGQG